MNTTISLNYKLIMDNTLSELVERTRCQCCGNVLDGSWWNKHQIDTAKPSYMELEFCSFVCERTYSDPWGYQRKFYNRTTKF
jgi:hypothetical protein